MSPLYMPELIISESLMNKQRENREKRPMFKGLEHLIYEERLKAGTVYPGEKKDQGGSHQCT